MSKWKYAPRIISVFNRGRFYPDAPVVSIKLHPPVKGTTHPGTAIRGEAYLVEFITPVGRRTYGVADGCIDSTLRMAVKLWPGAERDEVVAKWKNAPANVCRRQRSRQR